MSFTLNLARAVPPGTSNSKRSSGVWILNVKIREIRIKIL